ncbi:MAG: hypothetical protein CMJ64_09620 [Planctomycetaceae bacterium]|nr:hypothetical protein [Planctomycetaceae bacterium]
MSLDPEGLVSPRPTCCPLIVLTAVFAVFATTSAAAPFELRDGDRVVFVGGSFIERMQQHGYLETLLTTVHRDRNITFRNLGWSGDNAVEIPQFDPLIEKQEKRIQALLRELAG